MNKNYEKHAILKAGVVLGLGLGGLFDGIVFHQILQWHHMLTSAGYPPTSVPNLELNTLADGLFHGATWVITVIGLFWLWQVARTDRQSLTTAGLAGSMAIGWGLFNLVEGVVNHHLLGLHHVRSGPDQVVYDIAFLVFGALLVACGWWLARSAGSQVAQVPARDAG